MDSIDSLIGFHEDLSFVKSFDFKKEWNSSSENFVDYSELYRQVILNGEVIPVYDKNKHLSSDFSGFVDLGENKEILANGTFEFGDFAYLKNGVVRYIQDVKDISANCSFIDGKFKLSKIYSIDQRKDYEEDEKEDVLFKINNPLSLQGVYRIANFNYQNNLKGAISQFNPESVNVFLMGGKDKDNSLELEIPFNSKEGLVNYMKFQNNIEKFNSLEGLMEVVGDFVPLRDSNVAGICGDKKYKVIIDNESKFKDYLFFMSPSDYDRFK